MLKKMMQETELTKGLLEISAWPNYIWRKAYLMQSQDLIPPDDVMPSTLTFIGGLCGMNEFFSIKSQERQVCNLFYMVPQLRNDTTGPCQWRCSLPHCVTWLLCHFDWLALYWLPPGLMPNKCHI